MTPRLIPGQGILTVRFRWRRRGQIRVVKHPADSSMWIVKRLSHRLPDGRWHLVADNAEDGSGSERFGPVDLADSWLVIASVPLRLM